MRLLYVSVGIWDFMIRCVHLIKRPLCEIALLFILLNGCYRDTYFSLFSWEALEHIYNGTTLTFMCQIFPSNYYKV